MANRASALEGHYNLGRFGADGDIGVTLTEVRDLCLYQISAWPDTISEVGTAASAAAGEVLLASAGQGLADFLTDFAAFDHRGRLR